MENHRTLLSSLKSTHDKVVQSQSTIGHELHNAQGLAKIHELCLDHANNVLSALDTVIGEVRARFQARGIPLYPNIYEVRPTTMPNGTSPETPISPPPQLIQNAVSVSLYGIYVRF